MRTDELKEFATSWWINTTRIIKSFNIWKRVVVAAVSLLRVKTDKASLPDNFLSAIAYVPEAVKICIPHLDSVVEAEANEVDRIRETGEIVWVVQCHELHRTGNIHS